MKSLGVVDGVDDDGDGTPPVLDALEAAAIDFFGLEALMKLSALATPMGALIWAG